MSSTWLSSTESTSASSSPRSEAGSSWSAANAQDELLGVHVDLGDLIPGGAHLIVVALDEEGRDGRGVGGAQGQDVEQLTDLDAGGVDDLHVFEFGERE